MTQHEPDLTIDINKVIANLIVMSTKEAVGAMWERFRASSGKEITSTDVNATIDISKLRPWKKFEKAVLVMLEAYPGLVELLQDDNLRNKILLYDTGAGMLITTQDVRSYLVTARVSYVSGVLREVQSALGVIERSFVYGSYGDSIRSLFDDVQQALDPDFRELVTLNFEHLEGRLNKAGIKEFVHLQIPVLEYDSRLKRIFREIALLCGYWVKLVLKFIGKLPSNQQATHSDRVLRTISAANGSVAMLKGLCDKYNLDESYRFNEVILDLKKIEEMISTVSQGEVS